MNSTVENATEIRPFRVNMPEEAIADLRRRIAATRWPSKELVDDRSQGVQLATIRELTAALRVPFARRRSGWAKGFQSLQSPPPAPPRAAHRRAGRR